MRWAYPLVWFCVSAAVMPKRKLTVALMVVRTPPNKLPNKLPNKPPSRNPILLEV